MREIDLELLENCIFYCIYNKMIMGLAFIMEYVAEHVIFRLKARANERMRVLLVWVRVIVNAQKWIQMDLFLTTINITFCQELFVHLKNSKVEISNKMCLQ